MSMKNSNDTSGCAAAYAELLPHSWNFSIFIVNIFIMHITKKHIFGGILVGRPEGRRPLGRPRHRWEDNIKMDLREVEWGGHELD
jgi:hypothetical protein